jgi:hypothetical protein
MSCRSVSSVKGVLLLAAACLVTASQVSAGDRVHAPNHPATEAQPPSASRVVAQPATFAVVVTAVARLAPEPFYVKLRGPDGQVRRFTVEGGREAIRYQPAVVLRPGQSVTIQWVAAR